MGDDLRAALADLDLSEPVVEVLLKIHEDVEAAYRADRDRLAAELADLRSRMPRCAGTWLSGSGGHRKYAHDCTAVGIWDIGGGYVCDAHKTDGDHDAWEWWRERDAYEEANGDIATAVEAKLFAQSLKRHAESDRDRLAAELAEVRRERDDEAASRARWIRNAATYAGERDAAVVRAETAEAARDNIEARIVSVIESALASADPAPDDVSAEVARMHRAVRINVKLRERAEQRAKEAEAECAYRIDAGKDPR